ncbi:MAG TPA: flagellar basal-body MS-ring/collar protein FliF [Anaerolineae bacterium]|nr:flagellar basal-body MS-ring/collar protein FliF [Anaerolineae bacterium]
MQFLTQIKEQLLETWGRLSSVQHGVLVGLTVLGLIMMAVFVNWARTPDYAVAFRDLEESEAGVIVEKLQEQAIPYKLGSGGAILVPRASVYDVRLSMAKEGLPKGGTIGFELFDGASLGMTEFSQVVNYRRALEGELARTIGSLDLVEQARVHLVLPEKSLYASQQVNPTASIVVELAPGASLSQEHIRSIRYLVAASVEGLSPDSLTIVDTSGSTLATGTGEVSAHEIAIELTSQQMRAQRSYEQAMEAELQGMLERLVGPARAIVKTSVEMDWNQIETMEETYSPGADTDQAVLRSSHETYEDYSGTLSATGGIPGTASNLPPEIGSATVTTTLQEGSGGAYQKRDILRNYEVSRVESRTSSAPGKIERVSVSVLLDSIEDPQQIADVKEAVEAAVGLDAERGDVISVKSLPFDRSFYEQEAQGMDQARRYDLYVTAAKWGGLGIFVLVLLLYVRGLLNSLRPAVVPVRRAVLASLGEEAARALPPGPVPALESATLLRATLARQVGDDRAELHLSEREEADSAAAQVEEAHRRIQRQVKMIAETDPDALAEVIRSWIST